MTPVRVVVAASLLYFVAIPFDWISGTSTAGSVAFTGIEVFVFGACSVGAAMCTLVAGRLMQRRRRGLALFVTMVVSGSSMLFALTAIVAIGAITSMVNAVIPDEIVSASVGPGIWLVALAATLSFVGVVWGLTRSPDQMNAGAPLKQWLTLPAALIRASKAHLATSQESSPVDHNPQS